MAKDEHDPVHHGTSGKPLDLDAVIETASELIPLHPTLAKLSIMLMDTNASFSEMSDIVAYDQALTVKLLHAANSSYFGRQMRITTVQDAMTYIGGFRTFNLLVSCTLGTELNKVTLGAYEQTEGQLWRDSVLACVIAEQCSKVFKVRGSHEVPICALLLNIGKVVLARFLDENMLDSIAVLKQGGKNQLQAEHEVLQMHYGDIGALVVEGWGLPSEIGEGIKYQDNPEAIKQTWSDVAHIASRLVTFFTQSPRTDRCLVIEPAVVERLQPASKRWLTILCHLARESYAKVCLSYGVTKVEPIFSVLDTEPHPSSSEEDGRNRDLFEEKESGVYCLSHKSN